MGSGKGNGHFSATYGSSNRNSLKGTLIAAATSTATDAGGEIKKSPSSNWYDGGLPMWMFPYGHPEHTRRMEMLKGLKGYLEEYKSAHDDWGVLDGKSWVLEEGIKKFGEHQRKKQNKKK